MGSAYALSRAFPNVTIGIPSGLDKVAKNIISKLEIEYEENISPESYDEVVVLDTSSPELLDMEDVDLEGAIVIDHHADSGRWGGALYYGDDSKRSCAEIIKEILDRAGKKVDEKMGLALLAGMITDSGHFRYATPELMRTFADIMEEAGVEIDRAFDLTNMDQEVSERISQLKGGQRLRFRRVGDYIAATSHSSAYESSVCRSLIILGADVAFVGSQKEDDVRISARAKQDLVRKGLHLGRMMEKIGIETGNEGGGHDGAAGLRGTGDNEAILNICMEKALEFFRGLPE